MCVLWFISVFFYFWFRHRRPPVDGFFYWRFFHNWVGLFWKRFSPCLFHLQLNRWISRSNSGNDTLCVCGAWLHEMEYFPPYLSYTACRSLHRVNLSITFQPFDRFQSVQCQAHISWFYQPAYFYALVFLTSGSYFGILKVYSFLRTP